MARSHGQTRSGLAAAVRRSLVGLMVWVLCLALAVSHTEVSAAQGTGATINVFCLDFGKDFPEGQTIAAKGLANDQVRSGLAYAQSKGYVSNNPYQVQLAVWNLQDNQPFHDQLNQGTTIAQEIVTNAGTTPGGDAAAVATLTLTTIHETSPKAAYGTATVQGSANTSGLPVGFLLPASGATFQNLVAVVSAGSAQAAPTVSGTATTSATAAATAASTSAPTAGTTAGAAVSATAAATASPAPTATVSVPSSAPATGAGGTSGLTPKMGVIVLFVMLVLCSLAGVASARFARGTR